MTLRTYRVTESGRRVELSRTVVSLPSPGSIELSSVWPLCRCPLCQPPAVSNSLPSRPS